MSMGYIISSKRQIRKKKGRTKRPSLLLKAQYLWESSEHMPPNPICFSALIDAIPPHTPKKFSHLGLLKGHRFLFLLLQSDFSSILVFCQWKMNSFRLPLWASFQHPVFSTVLIFLLQAFLTQCPPPNITSTGSFPYQGHGESHFAYVPLRHICSLHVIKSTNYLLTFKFIAPWSSFNQNLGNISKDFFSWEGRGRRRGGWGENRIVFIFSLEL